MPTYEYECKMCKHRFDVFQSMKDEPVKKCERCGNEVRRLFGAGAGIIFKGSGFYVNDYKKNDSQKEKKTIKSDNKVEADPKPANTTKKERSA
ncbi:MAG: FmdB family zinc ribbon protein [Spirochaetota bacterium]|nr:FmdB family zinc ribbon protein [Spirochaetota bacterium]